MMSGPLECRNDVKTQPRALWHHGRQAREKPPISEWLLLVPLIAGTSCTNLLLYSRSPILLSRTRAYYT
jgi:hypothetical protein